METRTERERIRFLGTWVWLSAVLVVGALWFMGYWHDVSNARYLVPLQTFPLLALAAVWRKREGRFALSRKIVALLILGLAAVWAGSQIRKDRLVFPYPDDVAQLDRFCRERHLTRGLSDYWTLHYVNVLGRAGVRVSALRAAANSTYAASTASFWNNNVYGFLDRDTATGKWRRPIYEFVVINRLDESSLRKRFGDPREKVNVGAWKIWILRDPATASAKVLRDVEERLRGRRWDAVKADLE